MKKHKVYHSNCHPLVTKKDGKEYGFRFHTTEGIVDVYVGETGFNHFANLILNFLTQDAETD